MKFRLALRARSVWQPFAKYLIRPFFDETTVAVFALGAAVGFRWGGLWRLCFAFGACRHTPAYQLPYNGINMLSDGIVLVLDERRIAFDGLPSGSTEHVRGVFVRFLHHVAHVGQHFGKFRFH